MFLEHFKKELSCLLQGTVLMVGIGNELRSDDGFGPALIKLLHNKINATCIDAGLSPENYIGKIIKYKPDTIVFLDAVSMDKPIASVALIRADQIPEYGFSTHNMSPKLMIENLAAQMNATMIMIGIQPQCVEFGEEMSEAIKKAMIALGRLLVEILGNNEK